MNKDKINELVKLYFLHNPNMNKGIGFKIKANDIITKYANNHNMPYDEIKNCIEKNPMSQEPIWDMFYNYWFNKPKEKKSDYKDSINNSTDITDWL